MISCNLLEKLDMISCNLLEKLDLISCNLLEKLDASAKRHVTLRKLCLPARTPVTLLTAIR